MHPVRFLHNIDFHNLIDKHKFDFVESIWEPLDLVLASPLYNICSSRADENLDMNKFFANDVKEMQLFCGKTSNLGFHGHILCRTF